MSMQQTSLSRYEEDEDHDDSDESNDGDVAEFLAAEQTQDQHTCQSCGAAVSADYCRVRGDNDDNVHACPQCEHFERRVRDGVGKETPDRVGNSALWQTIEETYEEPSTESLSEETAEKVQEYLENNE